MKAKTFQRLSEQYLISQLEGFEASGSLLYRSPIELHLGGVHFDSSQHEGHRFSVWVLVQPLYVPATTLKLTFGRRLGSPGRQWWDLSTPAEEEPVMNEVLELVQREAVPFIGALSRPGDLIRNSHMLTSDGSSLRFQEALAYAHVLADGDVRALEAVVSQVRGLDDPLPWELEIQERALMLLRQTPAERVLTLKGWAHETQSTLGLQSTASR